MFEHAASMDSDRQIRAARLALASVLVGLMLGGTSLWLAATKGTALLWGFGLACLLSVAPALSVHGRVRDGLGNLGLERERLTLRITSHLLRLLALGLAVAAVMEWMDRPPVDLAFEPAGLGVVATVLFGGLWMVKRGHAELHPTLDLDSSRTRALLELAILLVLGTSLGRWFAWAGGAAALAVALRLFLEGNTLAKGTAIPVACGGCGGGCGCG